jgi:hypothetical protein
MLAPQDVLRKGGARLSESPDVICADRTVLSNAYL